MDGKTVYVYFWNFIITTMKLENNSRWYSNISVSIRTGSSTINNQCEERSISIGAQKYQYLHSNDVMACIMLSDSVQWQTRENVHYYLHFPLIQKFKRRQRTRDMWTLTHCVFDTLNSSRKSSFYVEEWVTSSRELPYILQEWSPSSKRSISL